MRATTFGIVYATASKMVLRIILPDSDTELHSLPLRDGETLLITPSGRSDIFTCQKLVKTATGVTPLNSRHAVIDSHGNVVAIDNIEPTLDGPTVYPGMTFVQSDVAQVGMTFSPVTGFSVGTTL